MPTATRMSGGLAVASVSSIGNSMVKSTGTAMTDDRPRPKYGEYGPVAVPPVSPSAPTPAPTPMPRPVVAATLPPTRPAWDTFATTLLLMFGVFDVVTGFGQFSSLAHTLRAAYQSQGFPAFTSDDLANSMGTVINVARVVVLVAAIVVTLVMIRAGRRTFWVPLAGAVLSALIVIVCLVVVILNDPALAEYVSTRAG
ncbi:MAG: DUF6264 family protein [Rhodoglobus sp.]